MQTPFSKFIFSTAWIQFEPRVEVLREVPAVSSLIIPLLYIMNQSMNSICKGITTCSSIRRQFFKVSLVSYTSASSVLLRGKPEDGSSAVPPPTPTALEWRKKQLDRLERKFSVEPPTQEIGSDDELQPMWQQMERRVKNRRSLGVDESNRKIGRTNVRKTDEDIWLQEGLYEEDGPEDDANSGRGIKPN